MSTCAGWPNGKNLRLLASKFELDQTQRKSTQVDDAGRRKWMAKRSPDFASTYKSVWPGLYDKYKIKFFKKNSPQGTRRLASNENLLEPQISHLKGSHPTVMLCVYFVVVVVVVVVVFNEFTICQSRIYQVIFFLLY